MRGALVGGVASAVMLSVVFVGLGFVSGIFTERIRLGAHVRDNRGPLTLVEEIGQASICSGITAVVMGTFGFAYGVCLGSIVERWSCATPSGKGFRQAALIAALFAGVVAGLPCGALLIGDWNPEHHTYQVIFCMGAVLVVVVYNMLVAFAVRWDLNRIAIPSNPTDDSTAIKSGPPASHPGNGSTDIFHK